MRLRAALVVALTLAVSTTGCIKKILLDGQIEGTRQGADAADTIGDYELVRSATEAGLLQFEGMHTLAPDNDDALFLLVKGWTGYAFGFIEDDAERSDDAGTDAMTEYDQKRALMAYDRAIFYGAELLGHKEDGFAAAKKDDTTMRAWLAQFDDADSDPDTLFWLGYAYMARANLMKASDDPRSMEAIGELFIGVAMMDRVAALKPDYNHYASMVALAAYHARPMVDAKELDLSKQLFETALARTERKSLVVQLNYARAYACAKGDKTLYEAMLHEVLSSPDPDPQQRLTNAIAKRRAERYLSPMREQECSLK